MAKQTVETSPQTLARIGGVLYLIIIVAGLFGEMFVRGNLIVSGDAAATAKNVMASEMLWRVGFSGEVLMWVCDVAVTLILYVLLKPVSDALSLLAALFRLVSIAIAALNALHHLAVVFLLANRPYLSAFTPDQRHALALLSLKAQSSGYNISLVFFGVSLALVGYLMSRSGYFPKFLGVLLPIAGACYLVNSFAGFLAPTVAARLFPFILVPCFLAEASLCLWLMVKGVNVQRWEEHAKRLIRHVGGHDVDREPVVDLPRSTSHGP